LKTNENPETDAGFVSVDETIVLKAGVALATADDKPAWIINRYGNGHTLLLNHPFRNIQRSEGSRFVPAEWNALVTFIRDLPDMAGKTSLTPPEFFGRVYQYDYGDASLYAILADMDASRQETRLPFKADDIVYNALTGELVRRPHRYRFKVAAGDVALASRLPYKVKELRVEVPDVAYTGQHLPVRIMVQVEEGKPGKHLFIVDLLPWNKPALPWYRNTITAEMGYAELNLPLAMNEGLGRYTLRVRDALTGIEVSSPLKIATPVE
jgi:hypothetical protein